MAPPFWILQAETCPRIVLSWVRIAAARVVDWAEANCGTMIAARIPSITTTIRISIRVKPRRRGVVERGRIDIVPSPPGDQPPPCPPESTRGPPPRRLRDAGRSVSGEWNRRPGRQAWATSFLSGSDHQPVSPESLVPSLSKSTVPSYWRVIAAEYVAANPPATPAPGM